MRVSLDELLTYNHIVVYLGVTDTDREKTGDKVVLPGIQLQQQLVEKLVFLRVWNTTTFHQQDDETCFMFVTQRHFMSVTQRHLINRTMKPALFV